MVREKDGNRKRRCDQGRSAGQEYHVAAEEIVDNKIVRKDSDEEMEPEKHAHEETDTTTASKDKNAKAVVGGEAAPGDTSGRDSGEMEEDDEEFVAQLDRELFGGEAGVSKKRAAFEGEDGEDDKERKEADMERLQKIREKREEDKAKREAADPAGGAAKESVKEAAVVKQYPEIITALEKLMPSVGTCFSLNQLNQAASCKKLLKPLLKKWEIKQLNKLTLSSICKPVDKVWQVTEEAKVVYLTRKA